MRRRPHTSSLFPYTTLFRSRRIGIAIAVGVGITSDVQPMAAPAFAVMGRLEQPVDQFFVRVRSGVSQERLNVDRKSTRLNSSHTVISYAVFCLKKKNEEKDA